MQTDQSPQEDHFDDNSRNISDLKPVQKVKIRKAQHHLSTFNKVEKRPVKLGVALMEKVATGAGLIVNKHQLKGFVPTTKVIHERPNPRFTYESKVV